MIIFILGNSFTSTSILID